VTHASGFTFRVDALHACAVECRTCQVRDADPFEKDLEMLNERAREIHSFIQRYRRENGSAPTIREIGRQFEISSTNGVRYYLNLLEKAGYIRRTGGISRGIGPSVATSPAVGIPVLGRVAAGQPILAEENWTGSLELADMFGQTENLFALLVRGDSMIDAGILQGDHVIVKKQDAARPGEIVVALIDDEATVKYYRPHRDRIELVAANAKYAPIVVGEHSGFRILGIVRGVIRTVGRS
jgi:repressor LexA